MNNQLQNVADFMTAFGQKVHTKPQDNVPKDIRLLRARLILEEALECVNALGFSVVGAGDFDSYAREYERFHGDKPEFTSFEHENADGEHTEFELVDDHDWDLKLVLDGLVDLDYVGHKGTALALGLGGCLEEADAEVHRSNMSKWWTKEDVERVTMGYVVEEVIPGGFSVSLNGKVIKAPSYRKPNLQPIIDKAKAS